MIKRSWYGKLINCNTRPKVQENCGKGLKLVVVQIYIMSEIIVYLRPNIIFKGNNIPDTVAIDKMHHRAQQECFIANSVLTEIVVQPVY